MTDPKIITGIQSSDALLLVAYGYMGAPLGMSVQPMAGSLFLQAAVSSFHQIQADAALASRTRLAEQFKSYKPDLTLTADFNTQRDQKDVEDGVIG